jgi:hypothetical protein
MSSSRSAEGEARTALEARIADPVIVNPPRFSDGFGSAVHWHESRRYRLVGHDFAVRATDPGLVRAIDAMYGPCADDGCPTTWYSVVDGFRSGALHALYVNDDFVIEASQASIIFGRLIWDINRSVIEKSTEHVLVHAAVATLGQVGVMLPAAAEAGKSTLVAGLVRSGFDYLTDEAAAIDPATLEVVPFPKPLSIDEGSFDVLAAIRPTVEGVTAAYFEGQWQVPANSIRPNAVGGPVRPTILVFPRFAAEQPTVLVPMRRSEALVELLRNTFDFHADGRRNFVALGRLVAGATCYRISGGSLEQACARIRGLVNALGHVGGSDD